MEMEEKLVIVNKSLKSTQFADDAGAKCTVIHS